MTEGFKINASETAVEIVITDPVIMERLITVLHRSNSTKIKALRESLIAELSAPAQPVIKPEPAILTEAMIAELESIIDESKITDLYGEE